MPVSPVCKCGRPLQGVNRWECEPCKLAYADEVISLRERVKRLEDFVRSVARINDYYVSEDIAATMEPLQYNALIGFRRMALEALRSIARKLLISRPPATSASPAEPDPTPLRTCLELLAQLGVEAQRLNRAGNVEALRAMAGRLEQVRVGA